MELSSYQLGNTSTAGWQCRAVASVLARSTLRLMRLVSIPEIVGRGMPHSADSSPWLSPCSPRMMRTDWPVETSMRFLAGMGLLMSSPPAVVRGDANDQDGLHDSPDRARENRADFTYPLVSQLQAFPHAAPGSHPPSAPAIRCRARHPAPNAAPCPRYRTGSRSHVPAWPAD